jgi:hypothetical protein
MVIWYIFGNLVYNFRHFGMLWQEKIWQPWVQAGMEEKQ